MPTLSELADVLIGCRVVSRERWTRAARAGRGRADAALDALTAEAPEWWTPSEGPEPPGLTEYQRSVIDAWLGGDDAPLARQLAMNQFLLLEKLGEGGQGEVYRGRQLNPPRFVAVKTLTRDTDSKRARFEQEARAMMKVQHPAVARFHLYERVRGPDGQPTDEYLIAMEFVDGTDLHRMVRWSGPIQWQFCVKWAIDILGGLSAIHQSGFIHRDVKPANVIALGPPPDEPGTRPSATAAKLLDFGAVGKVESRPLVVGNKRIFIGTREFAPPEQWHEQVVPESDLYALGGTLFHALTGRPPYVVEDRDALKFMKAHVRDPIPFATEHNPKVPKKLSLLLQKMMAKKAEDRGTAAELRAEFLELLPPDPEPAPAARKDRPGTATAQAKASARPSAPDDAEPRSPLDRALGPMLAVLERVFLPDRLRPLAGHELSFGERAAALLRRPAVLLLIGLLVIALIFWAVR